MGYSKTNERLAVDLKEQINEIRDTNEKTWKSNEDVIELMEEIESVGYFYDEDSWNVYANDDEYYDESPLELYHNDDYDEDEDEDYDKQRSHFGFDDEVDY